MASVSEYFSGFFRGLKSLLTGMRITWGELWTKKITEQYPENRATLVIPDRFKGRLIMPHDQSNEHACTACGICQINCPNGTIKVLSERIETEDGKKKRVLVSHNYNLGMCTFCNLCVISCPEGAITFCNEFENAIFTKEKLVQKLNNEGSQLREKAPKAAPAPAPKKEAKTEVAKEAKVEAKTENVKEQPKEKEIAKPTKEEKPVKEEPKEVKEPKASEEAEKKEPGEETKEN